MLTPLETGHYPLLLLGVLERGLGHDGADDVGLGRRRGGDDLLRCLAPRDGLPEERLLLVAEEADVDEDFDELGEAAVAEGLDGVFCQRGDGER